MLSFSKFHGFGNDYIVIEANALAHIADIGAFTKEFCDRHTGVGSDGIAILERLDDPNADFSCRIINPDGSEAGFSGNGTRCAVAYAFYKKLWSQSNVRLKTKSGIKNYRLVETIADGHYWFDAEIGKPRLASDEVPFASSERMLSVIDQPVTVMDHSLLVSCVNVGNPVACVFVENFEFNWREIGRRLETHTAFPERANIVFVKVVDRDNIELRIWERGAGETSASGTCSSGAAVLTAFRGETNRRVNVHTEGGTTIITWRDDDEIMILGRADFVFSGEYGAKASLHA
ncbi:MAG: diaminopimelate epimerase [Acidobacteria bacterium]|nr:diaminopimelate epimerase [Acidobacteriota bacterium]